MAFNGTGQFVRLFNWVSDAANLINITASRMDSETQGIADGLSNCVTRDGQGKPTAAIDWNGQNLSNVANLGIGTSPALSCRLTIDGTSSASTDSIIWLSKINTGTQLRYTFNNPGVATLGIGADASGNFIIGKSASNLGTSPTTFLTITQVGAITAAGPLSGVSTLAMAGALSGVTTLVMGGALSGVTTLAMGGALSGVTTLATSGLVSASAGISTGANDNTGRGMTISRSKPATTSRNSTTAFADDPDLVIPLGIGTYSIDCFMSMWGTTSGAGGFKMTPVFSGTSTSSAFSAAGFILGSAISNTTTTQGVGGGPYSGNTTTVSAGTAPSDWTRFQGTITVSVAGNFKIQWAQVSSNANSTNVGLGSWLSATQVA